MYKKIIFQLLLVVLFFSTSAQPSKFTRQEFYDDFNDSSIDNWSIKNDVDNFFILENGEYKLYRKNLTTANLIFCGWENRFNNFEVRMNFRFEKNKNKDQYAGIIFKAGKNDALLVEINSKGLVRMRKIEDGKSTYMTGKKKEEGWVKISGLRDKNNLLAIQSDNDNYTIAFNGKKVLSLNIKGYPAGRMGIAIGANTKICIDNLWVYTEPMRINNSETTADSANTEAITESSTEEAVSPPAAETKPEVKPESETRTANSGNSHTQRNSPNTSKTSSSAEIAELQKKIYDLQLQLNLYRNKMYKEQDRADSLQAIFDTDGKKDYRDENKRLVRDRAALSKQNDSLYVLLKTYNEVKAAMSKGEGNEITQKLAEKLLAEKTLNYELEKRNKELEVQNKKLTLHEKSLQSELDKLKSRKSGKKE